MMDFRDVSVSRAADSISPGADWPDFERQHFARVLRHGMPVCARPAPVDAPVMADAAPAVFVGFRHGHFGHLIAEAAMRLPQTLAERPGARLVFTVVYAAGLRREVPVFSAVLDWFGVDPGRVLLVGEPTRFRDLSVAAQAEHLGGPPPAEALLALLEGFNAPHRLPAPTGATIYVSRGALEPGFGGHAGEAYLDHCLAEAGVQVVHPERLALAQQMRLLAGARHVVFAEGSALHGRQLLGRIDQDLSVLMRRDEQLMNLPELLARARSVEPVPAGRGGLHALDPKGGPRTFSALAFYDLPEVFDHFERLGVRLRPHWDAKAYEAARDAHVLAWLAAVNRPGVSGQRYPADPQAHYQSQLRAAGMEHLQDRASDVIRTARAAR